LLSFPVAREFAGLRLDRFIQTRIPRLSRTRAQEIVREAGRRADGSRRRPSDIVREGEVVLLVRAGFVEPDAPTNYGFLYEDDALFVLDKPAGLPVHPTATYHRNTLTYVLRARYGDRTPRIAHRLDRETSGVLACAKTVDDERTLKNAFENRRVRKSYLAIVRGVLGDDRGEITLPMSPVREGLHLLMEVRDDGTEGARAETGWEVVARAPAHTLVALHPRTGRQHQLRVHLSAIGHPIVGDKLYGPEREAVFYEHIASGMTPELLARLGHDRHALHAHRLSFAHPRTSAPIAFEAPLAPDLVALWDMLRAAP
jgi:23S rRNA pseudouridine1911/1915/1917 synthase